MWEKFHSKSEATILYNEFENDVFQITATSLRGKGVNLVMPYGVMTDIFYLWFR